MTSPFLAGSLYNVEPASRAVELASRAEESASWAVEWKKWPPQRLPGLGLLPHLPAGGLILPSGLPASPLLVLGADSISVETTT